MSNAGRDCHIAVNLLHLVHRLDNELTTSYISYRSYHGPRQLLWAVLAFRLYRCHSSFRTFPQASRSLPKTCLPDRPILTERCSLFLLAEQLNPSCVLPVAMLDLHQSLHEGHRLCLHEFCSAFTTPLSLATIKGRWIVRTEALGHYAKPQHCACITGPPHPGGEVGRMEFSMRKVVAGGGA